MMNTLSLCEAVIHKHALDDLSNKLTGYRKAIGHINIMGEKKKEKRRGLIQLELSDTVNRLVALLRQWQR